MSTVKQEINCLDDENSDSELSVAYGTYKEEKMHEWFQMVSFKERDHLENLGIDGIHYLLDHKRGRV
jgi:hypothetical protein